MILQSPQRYRSDLDPVGADERETAEAISRAMLNIADKTFSDGRHAIRSVHAKSHGLLDAELEVPDDLPPVLAQGLFRQPGRYQAVMRLSTVPGDILDDAVSTQRGCAIKVLGVGGSRLEGSEGASTQDFVMANTPRFNAPNAKTFLANLKLLEPTTNRAEGAKKALSTVLRGAEKVIEAFGGESSALKMLGGARPVHILGETFYSQLAIRYGDYIAKLQLMPVAPELTALTGLELPLGEDPDVIRNAVIEHFRTKGGTWELRVQLCSDIKTMPIDDPMTDWDETVSPFVTVARLRAAPQVAWSLEKSQAIDDGMGFSPWHGIADHRPLGALMRMRKLAYERSQRFRSERNAVPVREPRAERRNEGADTAARQGGLSNA